MLPVKLSPFQKLPIQRTPGFIPAARYVHVATICTLARGGKLADDARGQTNTATFLLPRSTRFAYRPIMPAKKKPPAPPAPGQPRHYDPGLGKVALTALAPRLKDLESNELLSVRTDVEDAAFVALATFARATAPTLRTRFKQQHEVGEFDMGHLDDLEDLAFAVMYAHSEASVHRAAESAAKLPATLVEQALEVESRMQALCEYHFRDDPEMAFEVHRLRPGHGHRDIASDLLGYARIYDLRKDIVSTDKKHYRDSDAADAKAIAGVILGTLSAGSTSKARTAQEALTRAWTLLCRSYDEVRTVGLHLLRHNQDKHRFFPSIYGIARNNSQSRRKTKTSNLEASNSSAPT